jgi:hypothetical protein
VLRTRMRSPGPCGAGRRQEAGGPERPGRVGRDLSDGKRSCDSAAVSALCCNVHRRHLAPSQPSARSARRHDAVCRVHDRRGAQAGRRAGAARGGWVVICPTASDRATVLRCRLGRPRARPCPRLKTLLYVRFVHLRARPRPG